MVHQCRLISASITGVEAALVSVEVSIGAGLPGMTIVGMADTAILEAKERVRSAIKSAGFKMPTEKIVVNLAPGAIRKSGAGFDLPIALGILAATRQIDPSLVEDKLIVGELSLYGDVSCVSGDLAFCIRAAHEGLNYLSAKRQLAPIGSIEQLCINSLSDLSAQDPFKRLVDIGNRSPLKAEPSQDFDYADVSGHECAKRALEIAAAGRHGLLMVGPPGSGKTMLASRLPTIMPDLNREESIQSASVHSVAGEDVSLILKGRPPFRSPHHSATTAGLLGGGSPISPGEASLAHNGVLFLDELAEFKPATLQSLRQPIESGYVTLTRACGKVALPARFMLIAATNPCPCGYFGDLEKDCRCTDSMIKKYMSRIGGPLIDRFDMQIDVHRIPSTHMFESGKGLDSATMKADVMRAIDFADWRKTKDQELGNRPPDRCDANEMLDHLAIGSDAKKFAISVSGTVSLSGRAIKSMLNVARTIADMDEKEIIEPEHIAEAHAHRMSDIIEG